MRKTIAIVEDEPVIRENYADALRRQGYQVAAYPSRPQALQAFRARLPDLVILDIGLDDEVEGGFDLCRQLRAESARLPIIFLTARDSDFDTVSGLRLGADDYLTKDISLPHLSARVAALFRRLDALANPPQDEGLMRRGKLRLDNDRLEANWGDEPLGLTVTELWIVRALVARPGHVKTRDQLMQEADILVDAATISTHIKRIRRKFLRADPEFDAIEAVYGVGYRWRGEPA